MELLLLLPAALPDGSLRVAARLRAPASAAVAPRLGSASTAATPLRHRRRRRAPLLHQAGQEGVVTSIPVESMLDLGASVDAALVVRPCAVAHFCALF